MTLDDLKKIQAIGTEILFDVVNICEKHNIEYFLMYGTLLGAIRHDGPIPWDDDVDIAMTRENYIKFLEVAPFELDPKNELFIMGSGDSEYLSELKIGRKGTKYYLDGTQDLEVMHQIQLDVFLIDYIKDISYKKFKTYEKIRYILLIAKLNWDEKKLIIRHVKDSDKHWKLIYILGLISLHLLRTIFKEKGMEKWIYKLFVDESKSSGKLGVVMNSNKLLHTFPEATLQSSLSYMYDGRKVTIPVGYHKILETFYGDYMKYPPEDKRYKKRFEQYIVEIIED